MDVRTARSVKYLAHNRYRALPWAAGGTTAARCRSAAVMRLARWKEADATNRSYNRKLGLARPIGREDRGRTSRRSAGMDVFLQGVRQGLRHWRRERSAVALPGQAAAAGDGGFSFRYLVG